jgi:superfamily II DNA or RNA helicase
MKLTIGTHVEIDDPPPDLCRATKRRLTLDNPKFVENERMGRWNGDTPESLYLYEETFGGLIAPRGFARKLCCMAKKSGIKFEIDDRRRALPDTGYSFRGRLRPYQQTAVKDILAREFGTLSSPTGSGKTCMALYVIAKRKQPALVICHSKELLYQWRDRATEFLDMAKDEIGIIGGGKKDIGERLTIGVVNSVYKMTDTLKNHIGHLIVDECHRCPSRTFTEAVTGFDSKFMMGLSATPFRRDKLSKLIFWYLGDVVHEVDKRPLVENGDILRAEVITRTTDFRTTVDASEQYSAMLTELTEDPDRNRQIASDVTREARNGGGVCLVLSDRKAHCKALCTLLEGQGIPCEILTGDIQNSKRQGIVDRLNQGEVKVLVATGQLIGEGFDCKGLSTMFLTTPIRFDGRVVQYLGRVLRPSPGKKKAKVYDYTDAHVGVLKSSARARWKTYREQGWV